MMARASIRDLRFLPLVIVVAAIALVMKADDVVRGLPQLLAETVVIADVHAADGPPPGDGAGDPAAAEAAAADPVATPVRPAQPTSVVLAPADPDSAPTIRNGLAGGSGAALSRAEIEVLQQLAARRTRLDERETELSERSALLEAAETRIEIKVQELRQLRATLEELIASYEQQEDAKIRSLVKIYENMKPKDAAKIFEALEMSTLLLVAERMQERKLAPIMANMNPGKAKEMTVELARLRRVPEPPGAASDG